MPLQHLHVANSKAGNFNNGQLDRLDKILGFPGSPTPPITRTESKDDLTRLLESERNKNHVVLGYYGGDGTAREVCTQIRRIWGKFPPYIAHYPGGTQCNAPKAVGVETGSLDKLRIRHTLLGETSAVKLARTVRSMAVDGIVPLTTELGLLSVNGYCGFNVGFGIVPRLIWRYLGKTVGQFDSMYKQFGKDNHSEWQSILEEILEKKPFQERMIGLTPGGETISSAGAVSSAKAGITGIVGALIPHTRNWDYFNKPMLFAEVYIEGNPVKLDRPITGIFTASYEELNLGIDGLCPRPLPEARAVPGKMQILVTCATPWGIVTQIPKIFRGERLRDTYYDHVKEFEVRATYNPETERIDPLIAQIDGDLVVDDKFVVRYDRPLRFISLRN